MGGIRDVPGIPFFFIVVPKREFHNDPHWRLRTYPDETRQAYSLNLASFYRVRLFRRNAD